MQEQKKKRYQRDEEKPKIKKPESKPECTCHIKYPCRECINARRIR